MLPPHRPLTTHHIGPVNIQAGVDARRLGEIVAPATDLADDGRLACIQHQAAGRDGQEGVVADASEDFVAVVEAEVGEGEVDPCRPGGGEEGEEGEVEAVGREPEAVEEEDGDGDVVDSGFTGGAEVAGEG